VENELRENGDKGTSPSPQKGEIDDRKKNVIHVDLLTVNNPKSLTLTPHIYFKEFTLNKANITSDSYNLWT
jgi:hypothetical protein